MGGSKRSGLSSRTESQDLSLKDSNLNLERLSGPQTRDNFLKRLCQGKILIRCRMGVVCSCLIASSVLLINVSIFTWAALNRRIEEGSAVLYTGGCEESKRRNALLQLAINVLNSALLGSSNYCMQVAGAPTREEVDKAHARKHTMEIGVPSVTNLYWIKPWRAILWVVLGLSALPIHFIYNSAVILRTAANRYSIIPAPENFRDATFNATDYYQTEEYQKEIVISLALEWREEITDDKFEKLDVDECSEKYLPQYVTGWSDLVVVQSGDRFLGMTVDDSHASIDDFAEVNESSLYSEGESDLETLFLEPKYQLIPAISDPHDFPSCYWQCSGVDPFEFHKDKIWCNKTTLDAQTTPKGSKWRPFGGQVQYCWAKRSEERCSLSMHLGTGITVIVFNTFKVLAMAFTFFYSRKPGLRTLGDAIQSFIERPDPHTGGMCAFSANQIQLCWNLERRMKKRPGSSKRGSYEEAVKILQWPWKPTKLRWWRAVTPLRFHCFPLLVIALNATAVSLSIISGQDGSFHVGIGTVPGRNIVSLQLSQTSSLLLANSPQVLCSYIFLGFSYILTSIFVGYEWISFSQKRQALRVSEPIGEQRSTYFLQLPFKFSLVLLTTSALLSWLTSQMLFPVLIQVNGTDTTYDTGPSIITCGYSPGAMVIGIIAGSTLALSVFFIGLKRFSDGMPLAGTNSAAIAAACHVNPGDEDCALKPVKWGVVSSDGKEIGHCSFSAGLVKPLVEGKMYQ